MQAFIKNDVVLDGRVTQLAFLILHVNIIVGKIVQCYIRTFSMCAIEM